MNIPTVSIIIPSYNAAGTIAKTLDSVVCQQLLPMECLVVDGQSTDGTLEILKDYSLRFPYIQFFSEPDKGIYDAMNKGVRLSRGDYLFFLGADDLLYSDAVLEKVFANPDFSFPDLLYGDVVFSHSGYRMGAETHYLKLISGLENICHQSIFYARSLFDRIGLYSLDFPIYADFHFNVRCFRDPEVTTLYIPRLISIFNEKGASYFHRSRDPFIIKLHEEYVSAHEDPVALYDTVQKLERKLAEIMQSKEYRLGKKIVNQVRWYRRWFK